MVGAALLAASGGLLAAAALRADPGLNVSPWVALVVAAAMIAGALAVLARVARRPRAVLAFVVLLLGSFALTGAWIAFGPGQRRCASGWSDAVGPGVSGTECSAVFGTGAMISAAMMLLAVRQLFGQRHDGSE